MVLTHAEGAPDSLRKLISERLGLAEHTFWHPLAGGRTNRVWRIGDGPDALVCKLYGNSELNPLFPNLPGHEFDMLKELEGLRIAPVPLMLLHTPAGDALLYKFLEGQPWQDGVEMVARLLARVHGIPSRLPLRILPSGSTALRNQCEAILRECVSPPEQLLRLPADSEVEPVTQACLLHTDIVASNLIATGDGLRLIDWQCPAIGDPCEDFASFLSPAMQYLYGSGPLSNLEITAFLEAYGAPKTVKRYRELAALYHARIAAYCQWKAERGADDYKTALGLELEALQQYGDTQDHDSDAYTQPEIYRPPD